ncbi:M15 family metallopeptidase [Paraburkholderia bonniea]|uniref:M15 family metallopeptidase n=1 Tax=Paraburkholderia bonniea TaxID=2152891 RepID=UPI0012915044|nr:M15 family metallopeptidase [Paraburkholderia bonniea]WJF91632.1 M15 family metallopeptidase [Paraburkholderia bonniea]WJF94951.1 M15 family metallopeptidase [Paraburkholderia bonniea]
MKLLCALLVCIPAVCAADNLQVEDQRPNDFVNLNTIAPEIQYDLRYFTDHNFVGRRIEGYDAPVCLLTNQAAQALKSVQDRLLPMGLTLKVYDCYRPQNAVDDFAKWAKNLSSTKMRTEFYPEVKKDRLFSDGYIAYRSGHSRGSTMDLTIVPVGSQIPAYDPKRKQVSCTSPASQRTPDNSLDFGAGFDCFSPLSHPDSQVVSPQQRANRLLLQSLMVQAGFKPLDTEWWHFTLAKEPYPDTYFNFPVAN